ncbi:hypothetical protein ABUE31_12240 [Mesorhizobium sp. ZMM04-5]|uniref:Uncharacterized protein n=2 Tax=Mesorhizobium marinum TaxID=3228790 RepID=A0ABV3R2G9_9HYPH
MPASRIFNAALIAVPMLISAVATAQALPSHGSPITIRNDRGGQVIHYALKMLRLKEAGRSVRFSGRCDSACTLYLALPRSKSCVTPSASFGFHLPYGASRRGNQVAAQYLLSSYPGWVRSWVASQGGLNGQIKTMSYGYASRFLPTCPQADRKLALPQLRTR